MTKTTTLIGLILAAATLAGCAAPGEATRSITVGGEVFGYTQYEGAALRFPEHSTVSGGGMGVGFRSGLVITMLTRNGAPVTEADRQPVRTAAQLVCEQTRRHWYAPDQGVFLPSGGLSFAGSCG